MPRAKKQKYYAVGIGREGPKIYNSWPETERNVTRWPNAVHKSFLSMEEAENWLAKYIDLQHTGSSAIAGPSQQLHVRRIPPPGENGQTVREALREIKRTQRMTSSRTPSPTSFHTAPSTPQSCTASVQASVSVAPPPSASSSDASPVVLSPEQLAVLQRVKDGQSVFFTGSAGTGKSVLLREIIRYCRERDAGNRDSVAVTASTGIASVNIGGVTIHSWSGIGLGKDDVNKIFWKHKGFDKKQHGSGGGSQVLTRWRRAKTLVVDEISMLDGSIFDKLEQLGRMIRGSTAPFGGIQLVLSGDFYQLPPIGDSQRAAQFAFDAKSWASCVGPPVSLTHVFRQKEQTFIDMLNAIRYGHLTAQTIDQMRKLSRDVVYDDGIEPTDLFPTRAQVDAANNRRLNELEGPMHYYQAEDHAGRGDNDMQLTGEEAERILNRETMAQQSIKLKVGAQVMLIKNLIQGELVNGSIGKVVAFESPGEAVKEGLDIASIQREMTNNSGTQSDTVTKKPDDIPLDILARQDTWPVVKFTSGRTCLCIPTSFGIKNGNDLLKAQRDQVPLILAWAMSIHKSQGQTIERLRVDLGRSFEKGQVYVALSRATSMKTLQILNFDPARVQVHQRVLEWMGQKNKQDVGDDDTSRDLAFWGIA